MIISSNCKQTEGHKVHLYNRPGLCGTVTDFSSLSRILHCRLNVPHFLFFELFFNYCVPSLRREKETYRAWWGRTVMKLFKANILIQTWFWHTRMRKMVFKCQSRISRRLTFHGKKSPARHLHPVPHLNSEMLASMMYLTQTAYMYVHVQYYCSTCNYRLLSSDIIHNVLSGQLQYTVSIDAQKIQTELLHSPLFILF